jgi:hypothetical protein
MMDGKVKTVKVALQFQLPSWIGDLTGLQLLYEKYTTKSVNELTPLLLIGKKMVGKWSMLAMIGNQFVFGNDPAIFKEKVSELPVINLNLFFDYCDVFNLGLEVNLRGIGESFEELVTMPQVHARFSKNYLMQAGFGTSYDGHSFSPISAFRLIKEFNYAP